MMKMSGSKISEISEKNREEKWKEHMSFGLSFVIVAIIWLFFAVFFIVYSVKKTNDHRDKAISKLSSIVKQDSINMKLTFDIILYLDSVDYVNRNDIKMLEVKYLDASNQNRKLVKKNAKLQAKLVELSQTLEKHLKADSLK